MDCRRAREIRSYCSTRVVQSRKLEVLTEKGRFLKLFESRIKGWG